MYILTIFFILRVCESCYCVASRFMASHVKMKGTLIIRVKFRGAWKLMVLKCFIILYAQIFSCFENCDIQDLTVSIFIVFQLQS